MKQVLIAFLAFMLCSSLNVESRIGAKPSDKVYIVMSSTAYAYHRTRSCRGLKSATHTIKEVSLDDAINKYKRKPCGYCCK